ncbi:hypothetical protein OCU04_003226 [Sclerotinia nivalis]|uniref:Uncharacterized protein n=1 Tax=Sclerotinia nivalis TaxID=352851 RepID=A0A9X0ARJ4_9HELO|nr:hypothetical protein OCU04_003226 [Sclerotinia nivalis]
MVGWDMPGLPENETKTTAGPSGFAKGDFLTQRPEGWKLEAQKAMSHMSHK